MSEEPCEKKPKTLSEEIHDEFLLYRQPASTELERRQIDWRAYRASITGLIATFLGLEELIKDPRERQMIHRSIQDMCVIFAHHLGDYPNE